MCRMAKGVGVNEVEEATLQTAPRQQAAGQAAPASMRWRRLRAPGQGAAAAGDSQGREKYHLIASS